MEKKSSDTEITLFKWVTKSYFKIALIPLIFIELIFISIYLFSNSWSRFEFVEYIEDSVEKEIVQVSSQQSMIINQQLESILNSTELLREQALRNIQTGDFFDNDLKLSNISRLKDLMEDIKTSNPLVDSVLFNTFDSLSIRYPSEEPVPKFLDERDLLKYKFYYEADEIHNPGREVKWTNAYIEPLNNTWIASCIAPVYNGDFLEGVVAINITVDTIISEILEMDVPWGGYGILISSDGNVLALPKNGAEDWGILQTEEEKNGETIVTNTFKPNKFNIYNMEELSSFSAKVSRHNNGSSNISLNGKNQVVSWATISKTGWKLLVITPESNIYSNVNKINLKMFNVGMVIVICVIIVYIIFSSIVLKTAKEMSLNISIPLLQINRMVEKIGKGQYYQNLPDNNVKELKETFFELINMGRQLGETNKNLIVTQEELKIRESNLKAIVDSINDMIMEIDGEGNIVKLWTRNSSIIPKTYLLNSNNSIYSMFKSDISSLYKDKINSVIHNGEPEQIEYLTETNNGLKWFNASISLVENTGKTVVVSARDITERKEMEESIIAAKEAAEKASKAKSQFLSSMSHELRTPLNAILGFSQLLQMDLQDPLNECQSESVNEIIKAGNHLLNLINEVLDLSKIESGKMPINIKQVEVKKVVDETIALIKPMALKCNIELDISFSSNMDELVFADSTRLKQVLINLLSNAVKYNKKNGKIIFYCEKVGDFIRFNVADTGQGIEADKIDLIFNPFYRVDERNSTVEGTGIGLAVAKEIVQLMSGNISVESKVGVGSHFWVDIPRNVGRKNLVK